VCALALLVYSRSLWCEFLRDDKPQIVDNKQIQSWDYLPQILGSHLWSHSGPESNILFYRPVFSLWMLLMHTIGGLAPWFWHLSNILLHVAATYLVFRFCQRLTGSDLGSAAAAAVFAVHPIHVDAVTWVSASCEVLFGICAMAAMLALLGGGQDGHPRVWASALWFGAGMLAKETGIAMLAILPVFAWVCLQHQATDRLKNRPSKIATLWSAALPYGVVTAACLLLRWAVMHRVGVETGEHSWAEVVFSAPSIFLFYVTKLFLPWRLSGCYVNPITASPTLAFWLQSLAIVFAIAFVAWLAIRRRSLVGLAVAIIIVPMLPALAVLRVYPQGDMTHDRYLYLSSAGLSLLVAMLAKELWSMGKPAKTAASAVVVVILIAFSAETLFQQRFYQDDPAFYARALDVAPSNALARSMRANLYLDQRRPDLAVTEFRRAHHDAPESQRVTLYLARGLFVAGNSPQSEAVLKELLETPNLDPHRRKAAVLSLANVEISLGNLDYSQQLLQQVDQSDDQFPELHWAFGILYQKEGMLPQALAEYEKEFQITGDELAHQRSLTLAKRIYSQHGPGQQSTESTSR
jgi:tetratricopeptide (TPR) repeat protein